MMEHKDIGDALELFNTGISLQELSNFYEVEAIALNAVFKDITTFRNVNDRVNNTTIVKQSKINIIDTSDIIDYQ